MTISYRFSYLFMASILFLFISCGPSTPLNYCNEFATVLCEKIFACLPEEQRDFPVRGEANSSSFGACVDFQRYISGCERRYACDESSTIDKKSHSSCMSAMRSLSCEAFKQSAFSSLKECDFKICMPAN